MRITIVQGPFLPVPPLLGGAVEKIMQGLGVHWAAAGHHVTHISRRYQELPKAEERQGVQHYRVASRDAPAGRLAFRWAELGYCRRALQAAPPADILLSNAALLPLLYHGRSKGRLYVRLGRQPKGQLFLYRHASRLQALSQAQADLMRAELPSRADRIKVIGSPLPSPFVPLAETDTDLARDPTFLFVGRLAPEKGLALLIRAFATAQLPAPWGLTIIGPWTRQAGGGGDAYRRQLEALAQPLGGRCRLLGPEFDQTALLQHFRRAQAFVYPSLAERGETFGLSVLEALSQGAVPLVSGLAVFRDLVQSGVNGLVFDHADANAEQRLAQAMIWVTRNPDQMAKLRRAAVQASRSQMLAAVAQRYLEDFQAVLDGR